MCEDLGLIKPETITKCLTSETILNMEQYPPHEIEAIKKTFVLYVKFPKNRWKEIEKAEKDNDEGRKILKNLKEEFLEKYMPKPEADPHGTTPHKVEMNENPYCIPSPKDKTNITPPSIDLGKRLQSTDGIT